MVGWVCGRPGAAGSEYSVTVFAVLSQSQAVLPSAITSVSLSGSGTASRKCLGLEYQTRTVCDPVSSEAIEVGFAVPGRLGRPSEVVSTTVPVSGGVTESATWARSCAGVRGASPGDAWATEISDPPITAPVMTSAPAGIAHLARRDSFGTPAMTPHPLLGAYPLSSTMPRARCEHPETPARGTGRVGHTGSMRVLVVEDERRLASAVRRGLTAEGFVVDVAHDGVDGLHLAREGGYDAVVLDLMLPGLSGYQVCERLRADRNWVPVLILSAKDGEYDQADGLDLGADDYMTKPFSYVVLAARLRALLRRGARPRPAVLTAGDLGLDPAARTVRRGKTDIDLTAREFALLEYLMRRAGQVVPKAELLEHVWDAESVADLNVVEVYAGYLRRKIDGPFGRNALQTVRGAGYRLAADGG